MNNRLYKVIRSRSRGVPVVVAECLPGGGRRRPARRRRLASLLAASTLLSCQAWADTLLPGGADIVHGSAAITTSGNVMDVHQSSDRLIANWRDFSIGAGATVNFRQPGTDSVALNRVTGGNPSLILGALNANGNVFLVNPGGVVFGRDARVDVGGLVASTLDISNRRFLAGDYRFTGTGGGEIVNQGSLSGNVLALIAPTVRNDGTMRGDTALAGGTDVALDFDGDGLISVEVKASTVATLVENNGLIQADGGTVVMTARGAAAARSGVVNNTGTVEARAMASRNGRIVLLGDMDHGTANVGGRLKAKSVETSAARVRIAPGLRVETGGGNWLIDPTDIRVDRAMAEALMRTLQDGNAQVATSGAGDGRGDIRINAEIEWDRNELSFLAHGDIIVNAPLKVGGDGALRVEYNLNTNWTLADFDFNRGHFIVHQPVTLADRSTFSSRRGPAQFGSQLREFTVIRDRAGLMAISADPDNNYVLGDDIVADAMSPLAGPAVGAMAAPFTGFFEGLGNTISNVLIAEPERNNVGLFAGLGGFSTVQNLRLTNVDVFGRSNVGGLAGAGGGLINNVRVSGRVRGQLFNQFDRPQSIGTGGMVGTSGATIQNSMVDVEVEGHFSVGGFVGSGNATIVRGEARGSVTGHRALGGAAGIAGSLRDVLVDVAITGLPYQGNFGFDTNADQIGGATSGAATVFNTLVVGSINVIPHPNWPIQPHEAETHAPIVPNDWRGTVDPGTGQFVPEAPDNNFYLPDGLPEKGFPSYVGTPLTLAQARERDTYTLVGWDFVRDWGMPLEMGLPLLRVLFPEARLDDSGLMIDIANLSKRYGDANPVLAGNWAVDGCDGCIVDILFGPPIDERSSAGIYPYVGIVELVFAPGEDPGEYDIVFAPTALTINPRMVDLVEVMARDREYDRTQVARFDNAGTLDGVLFGDDVSHVITGNLGTFDTRHPGQNKPIEFNVTLVGSSASNYVINGRQETQASITPREVTLGGLAARSRIYDGTDIVAIEFAALQGVFAEDLAGVEVLVGEARVADKNAGDNRPVEVDFSLLGDEAINYTIGRQPDLTVDILRKEVGVVGRYFVNDKTYDGTTGNAPLEGLENLAPDPLDVIAGDDLSFDVSSVIGSYPSKNFDHDPYPVTLDGLMLAGADADNYFFDPASVPQRPGRINPRMLSLIGVRIATKEYDGRIVGQLADEGFLQGVIAGDDVVLRHILPPEFADKNAGEDKPVRVITSIEGADGRNYFLPFGAENAFTGTILPAPVFIIGGNVKPKTYDGTTETEMEGFPQLRGVLFEDEADVELLINAVNFLSPDANLFPRPARIDASLVGGAAGNYRVVDDIAYSSFIWPKDIMVSPFGVADKVYDGLTDAVLTGNPSLVGIVGRDIGFVSLQSDAHFDDKNVGQNKPVLPGFSIAGDRAGNYNLVDAEAIGFASITPMLLEVVGMTFGNRDYNLDTAARVTNLGTLVTPVEGDDVRIASVDARFANSDAGEDKPIRLDGTVLAGADAANYFTQPQANVGMATIDPRLVTVRGFTLPSEKIYDGETSVEIDPRDSVLINVHPFDRDLVRHQITGASVDDPDVGTRPVTVDVLLTGSRARNYRVQINDEYLLRITPRELSLGNVWVEDKIYDGTTAAFLSEPPRLENLVARDAGMVDFVTTAHFETKDVWRNQRVFLTGTLSGPRSHNYVFTSEQVSVASIFPRPLELSGYRIASKEYDGNQDAFFAVVGEVVGLVAGDDVRVAHPTMLFDDKNAGDGKTVLVQNFLVGNDRDNYSIAPTISFTSAISPRLIDVQGTFDSVDRTYDTTTRVELANLDNLFLDPLRVVPGDEIFLETGNTFGQIDTKDAGRNRMVALMDIELGGGDEQNYLIRRIPRSMVTINPAPVSHTGFQFGDKLFDGTTTGVILNRGMLNGIFPGDEVVHVFDAAFVNAGPGNDIPLEVLNVMIGPDGDNYVFDEATRALMDSQAATIFAPGSGFVPPPLPPTTQPPQTPVIVVEVEGLGPIVIVPPTLEPGPGTEPEDDGPQFDDADPVEAEDAGERMPSTPPPAEVPAEEPAPEQDDPTPAPPPADDTPAPDEREQQAAVLDANIERLLAAERFLVEYLDQLAQLGETINPAVFQRLAAIRALLSQFRQERAALEEPIEEAPVVEEPPAEAEAPADEPAESADAQDGEQPGSYPEVDPAETVSIDDLIEVLTLLLLLPQFLADAAQDDVQPADPMTLEETADEAANADRQAILEFIRRGTVVLPSGENFGLPPEVMEGLGEGDVEAQLRTLARSYLLFNRGLSNSEIAVAEFRADAVRLEVLSVLFSNPPASLDDLSDEALQFVYFIILAALFDGIDDPAAPAPTPPAPGEGEAPPSSFQEDDPDELGDGEEIL